MPATTVSDPVSLASLAKADVTLVFHGPCLDGVVSAALLTHALTEHGAGVRHQMADYPQRASWIAAPPAPSPFVVVDFLYHPACAAWFDHHGTAFTAPGWEADYDARRSRGEPVRWDPEAPSCADLLGRMLPEVLGWGPSRELIRQATRTDAAKYDSPEQALFGEDPELVVNRALAGADESECVALIHEVGRGGLAGAAVLPWVHRRSSEVTLRDRAAVAHAKSTSALRAHRGVGLLRWTADLPALNRYTPFLLDHDLEYSVVVVEGPEVSKLTVMRNPWRPEDPRVHLGRLVARYGGGGHRRVGSVYLRGEAMRVAKDVVSELDKG